jgi:endonuclease/exonuclease/phosphatase family metal-dependent hydrolase
LKNTFNISLFVISLFILSCPLIPPDYFWLAGFIAYGIPLILIVNIVVFVFKAFKRKISILYPLIVLVAGYGFLKDSFRLHRNNAAGDLKVVSFNTRIFNVYFNDGKDTTSVKAMIDWINSQDADILCFQEFYNDPNSNHFNTLKKISDYGNYYYFHSPKVINRLGAEFGDVIFSKYPILRKGQLLFEKNSKNKVIFVDLKVGTDTIRVYNMHLQSMHIIEDELINTEDLQSGFKLLTSNLKNGFIMRAGQIRILKENLRKCTYPILLCGDLNDLPYSYAYQKLNGDLQNGFSEAGNGFGFTFNGKLFFLRIDNHFFSNELKIHSYRTHQEMKRSDHFPVSATYSLEP